MKAIDARLLAESIKYEQGPTLQDILNDIEHAAKQGKTSVEVPNGDTIDHIKDHLNSLGYSTRTDLKVIGMDPRDRLIVTKIMW